MLKMIFGLAVIAAGVTYAEPASAHFSQVFGPFKAQLTSEFAEAAPATLKCGGRYAGEINADWLGWRGE